MLSGRGESVKASLAQPAPQAQETPCDKESNPRGQGHQPPGEAVLRHGAGSGDRRYRGRRGRGSGGTRGGCRCRRGGRRRWRRCSGRRRHLRHGYRANHAQGPMEEAVVRIAARLSKGKLEGGATAEVLVGGCPRVEDAGLTGDGMGQVAVVSPAHRSPYRDGHIGRGEEVVPDGDGLNLLDGSGPARAVQKRSQERQGRDQAEGKAPYSHGWQPPSTFNL